MDADAKREVWDFYRKHRAALIYAMKAAWNLREWLRECNSDPTLRPVLDSLLPDIRDELELKLIDSHLPAMASNLPVDMSVSSLIAFVEDMRFPHGACLRILAGDVPEEWKWPTLSRCRAEKIAMRLVDEQNELLFDPDNPSDLEAIEAMPEDYLERIWEFGERIDKGEVKQPEQTDCYVDLKQMAAIVNKGKRTLERLRDKGKLPLPAVKGGVGRADEWWWSEVRPVLEAEYRRNLPEVFPADRFIRR